MLKLYQEIARAIDAYKRCAKQPGHEWTPKWEKRIQDMLDMLPSGSGWDCGTKLDYDASSGEKLVFYGSYHHMNDGGMYDGWTEHQIIVTPSLGFGFKLRVTGRDRNQIKDYLGEMFDCALREEVKE